MKSHLNDDKDRCFALNSTSLPATFAGDEVGKEGSWDGDGEPGWKERIWFGSGGGGGRRRLAVEDAGDGTGMVESG